MRSFLFFLFLFSVRLVLLFIHNYKFSALKSLIFAKHLNFLLGFSNTSRFTSHDLRSRWQACKLIDYVSISFIDIIVVVEIKKCYNLLSFIYFINQDKRSTKMLKFLGMSQLLIARRRAFTWFIRSYYLLSI